MTTASDSTANARVRFAAPVRLAWADHLRTLMIALVVNMHACVTFSHVGSWYVNVPPPPPPALQLPFLLWQAHLQSFFMGLLFFMAGFFAHHSLERRGPRRFLLERARRLGLPSLLYMFVVQPFIVYVLLGHPHVPNRPAFGALYAQYLASGRVLSGNGPLWFALALLFFCVMLAGWRVLVRDPGTPSDSSTAPPSAGTLLLFAGSIALVTFLVRLAQPIGTNVLNFQLCFFTQYIAAFLAGLCAARRGWLLSLARSKQARLAGYCGVIGGPLALALIALLGGQPPNVGPNPYAGGWNLRALALAGWEQFTGLGIALGAIAFFSSRCNINSRLTEWLSRRSFGVYVFHAPVLVSLTPLVSSFNAGPIEHAALLTVVGTVASFIAADIAKRMPGLRAML